MLSWVSGKALVNRLVLRKDNGDKVLKLHSRFKHGHSSIETGKRGKSSPTYISWRAMLRRCNNPKHSAWPIYGGAGIVVCERWKTFANFLADMGERPAGTTLDRKDITKNYEPGNCCWRSPTEQAENRSTTHWIEYRGKRHSVRAWARLCGCSFSTFYRKLKRLGEQGTLDSFGTKLWPYLNDGKKQDATENCCDNSGL